MTWQPIEAAPKDGTVIEVPPDCGFNRAFFDDGFWFWYASDDEWFAAGPTPCGWMPLPPPPAKAE